MTKHQICLATSQEFYAGLSLAFRDPALSVIEVDMTRIHFLYPWQLTLAACLKVWAKGKARLTFHWNKAKRFQNEVVSYAEQVGLFAGLDEVTDTISTLNQFPYNPENYFELQRIEGDSLEVPLQHLTRLLTRWPELAPKLPAHLAGLAQNIFVHSGPKENTGWGFVQAQTTGAKLRIAYCDFGVGCYKTFQRNNLLQGRVPKEILEICLEPEGTSLAQNSAYQSRGEGLASICTFLEDHKGSMDFYSDGLRCRYAKGKKSTEVLGIRTKGTLVSIEIPLPRKSRDGW